MNKKTYKTPIMHVVMMRGKSRLMAGSVEGNAITGGYSSSGRGRARAIDIDDGYGETDW